MKVVFVVNPRSAGGGTGAKLAKLKQLADVAFRPRDGELSWVTTERPDHATELAAEHGVGADLVVSVGGDGTANEVVNGLARIGASERPVLGVLPAGTGSDLVRTLGMPRDLPDALGVLANGRVKAVDWLRVGFAPTADAGPSERICVNVAGFGMNGEIVKRANEGTKRLGGRMTFAVATARTALAWKPPMVAVEWDGPAGKGSWEGPLASVFVANGQYCGGGMWVGRGGSMSDGLAELTLLPEMPLVRTALGSPRLYTGTIGKVKGVVTAKIRTLSARPLDDRLVLLDVDGEQPGGLPIRIDVEPAAVRVVGQWVG